MELVFATNNKHKVKEITDLLDDNFRILGLADLNITEDIPEDADTLEENALFKARFVHEKTGRNVFADDTGLEVTASAELRVYILPGMQVKTKALMTTSKNSCEK